MQPEAPQAPIVGPERPVAPPVLGGEHVPVLPPIDTSIEKGADRREQIAEASAALGDVAAPQAPPSQAAQQDPATQVGDSPVGVVAGPPVAADEDVIEKEWVDKAKSIVAATMNDPHARTVQVGQLKSDYLKKRYGRDVGVA